MPPSINIDAMFSPKPLQLVSISCNNEAEEGENFIFHEESLQFVLSQVPLGCKISIVTVVGGFRTGKSFLINWFMQYLLHNGNKISTTTLGEDEDNEFDTPKWYECIQSISKEEGFHWNGGEDRVTTGMSLWSKPFFVTNESNENMAVILIDTQGMFDHETSKTQSAFIFGLSTLISSYQIFNVDKRIQEYYLEYLALFSEYGRLSSNNNIDMTNDLEYPEGKKPFQKIEFLVRDWQHFECDGEGDFADLEQEMDIYLKKVMDEHNSGPKGLQDTRNQIYSCFDSVSCFLLTHPGKAVTKNKYTGNVDQIDPTFLRLLDRYCQRVFTNLKPKKMHDGREMIAEELPTLMKAYINMFATGAVTSFPGADTLLEATATANNTNAIKISLHYYDQAMKRLFDRKFVRPDLLQLKHTLYLTQSLKIFEKFATIGNSEAIEDSREELICDISEKYEKTVELNNSRQGVYADCDEKDITGVGALLVGALALGAMILSKR